MLTSVKIRLIPTPEQEILFRKSAGIARWVYNRFIQENRELYKKHKENENLPSFISEKDFRKELTKLKKTEEFSWMKEVGSNVIKQSAKDAGIALDRYFKGLSGKPKLKKKYKSKMSFYVNYESLKRTGIGFRGEKLGEVKTKKPLPRLKRNRHYSNPRISFDGKYWYLSVSYDTDDLTTKGNKPYLKKVSSKSKFSEKKIGIDLGVKDLAIVSDDKHENVEHFRNINKTKSILRRERQLKREQRKLSRKIEDNIDFRDKNGKPHFKRKFNDCKNFQKQKKKVQLKSRQLTNIRDNYVHQTTSFLTKTKPERIVIEDLNVKGMMRNRHLSKAVQNQKLFEFRRQLEYKCKIYGIELVTADRWFPSTKRCSQCGNKKLDIKLSDRIYICEECGIIMDRDENAALNLANYPEIVLAA